MGKKKNCNDREFVEITNKDIYDKVCNIEKQTIKTNGTIKFHSKMIFALGGCIMTLAGFFISHLMG